MVEINVEQEIAKFQAELNSYLTQLDSLEQQRSALLQAITERQGILGYLHSLDSLKGRPSQELM